MKIVNTQRAITPKVGKPELRFMCSASHLMVFNICAKFHENMSSSFKVMVKKVKVSHSLIAVGAVGVRVPLYLGHS